MPPGPILIFDKSTLQSLNPDEAVWLDHFFLTNITPLFFIETLADLEKQVRAGRTPEQVVGNLAYKTPDLQSRPNVHHRALVAAELSGTQEIDIRHGFPIISGGQVVTTLEGKTGVIFQPAPEQEAFSRWQHGEFLEVERFRAKAWRQTLSNYACDEICDSLKSCFASTTPKTFSEAKQVVDAFVDYWNQETVLRIGLSLLDAPLDAKDQTMARWQVAGRPPLRQFAPYFTHVLSVDLLFYLAILAKLISRTRKSNRADFAYLYYLPFCMVFASSDNLHADIVPLFLRENQSFVKGSNLKADLIRLDEHYSALPDETKNLGMFQFAKYPPTDNRFLVTQLWDKHLPVWRKDEAAPQKPLDKDTEKKIVDHINRTAKESVPVGVPTVLSQADTHFMLLHRKVFVRKGKWKRFTPEAEKSVNKCEKNDG